MAGAEPLIALCPSGQLVERGAGLRFEVLAGGEVVGAFAVRFRGQAVAYLNRCAHVAMELDWVAGQFFGDDGETLLCATHGATYAPQTGECVGGPCRGSLVKINLSESQGVVHWHTAYNLKPLEF